MVQNKNQNSTFSSNVFITPLLIGWAIIAVQATYLLLTKQPMLFDKIGVAASESGSGAHFRTAVVLFTGAWCVPPLVLNLIAKIMFGKDWMDNIVSGQALIVTVASAFTLVAVVFGKPVPWMTYQFLSASLIVGAMLLVYGLVLSRKFKGDLVGWLLNKVTLPRHAKGRLSTALNPTDKQMPSGESEANVAREMRPCITFADIFGNKDIKQRLLTAAQKIVSNKRDQQSAERNGILLFGEPGNGKTVFAEALAGELKVPLVQLAHADVASKWVGERTTFVKAAFQQAISAAPCVFFVDEIDSFLESREGNDASSKEDRDVVNSLLTLMVDIRRHKVVVMAATNHLDRLDGAGIREGRFDFKVEITAPDSEARIGLLTSGVKKNLPSVRVDSDMIESIARRWNGFSVKRILAVSEELPDYLQQQGKPLTMLAYEDFMGALRAIQGRRGVVPENVKPLSELVLLPQTKDMISQITGRLEDPEYTESHGGTLPTGILFYGPPGTGKTATAKAIAHEIQWGFLPVTGADMARNPKELEKIYTMAKEIRPCLIFIDEADELLKSRDYSQNTEATNKLLTLMDGINDRVRDVVWVAATNNPEMIDLALLRSGRFGEKVLFELPSIELLEGHVDQWLVGRKVALSGILTSKDIATAIGEQSIANAEGILQAALNRAIARRDKPVVVTIDDVVTALKSVMG